MYLFLRVPQSESKAFPLALSLARAAPMFQMTDGRPPAYLAAFPDLSLSFDLAERLIGAAAELPDVQVSIDGQPVEGLTKFLNVLRCYRDSLTVPDLQAHCASRVASIGGADGCPDRMSGSDVRIGCPDRIASSSVRDASVWSANRARFRSWFSCGRSRTRLKWTGVRTSKCCGDERGMGNIQW